MITLYHSGTKHITEVKPYGENGASIDFGGIFALSDPESAIEHGPFLHAIRLNESDILTQFVIDTEISSDIIEPVLRKQLRIESEEDLDLARHITEFDRNLFDLAEKDQARLCYIFRSNMDELGWDGQRVRGQIALAAGYKAVEMEDEYGRSYLVLPGVKVELVTDLQTSSVGVDFLASLQAPSTDESRDNGLSM